jgi:hypothetical protein
VNRFISGDFVNAFQSQDTSPRGRLIS